MDTGSPRHDAERIPGDEDEVSAVAKKLDEAIVGEIRAALAAGESKTGLARRFKTYPARIRELERSSPPPPSPPPSLKPPPDGFDVVRATAPLIPSLANLPPAAPSYPLDLEDLPRRLREFADEFDAVTVDLSAD